MTTTKKIILSIFILILLLNFVFAATRTFSVEETDFIKINPSAIDLDNDKIIYTFSKPLDQEGEWQTGYNDSGEYNIKITASDGINKTTENVKLIVENKNQPPFLTENKLIIKEKQEVDLKEITKDLDGDILIYKFNEPFNEEGIWRTTYNDAGKHVIDFTIDDGEFIVEARLKIEVLPTNRPPTIEKLFSEEDIVKAKEGINFRFFVIAKDSDNDSLNYTWKLDHKIISTKELGNFIFDYNSSGEHQLHLCIRDGTSKINKEWIVNVENTNRKPKLELSDLTLNEGETLKLNLPKKDLDGDNLTYTFSKLLNAEGIWKISFEDSGKHKIKITANDGEYQAEKTINLNILDVDRAPQLILPKKITVNEGEKLTWKINTSDPDKDKVTISLKNAPELSLLDQATKTFTWEPNFDTIKRRGGFVSNILNSLRIEHFLIKRKVEKLEIEVCGKDLCSSGTVPLNIYNVNRRPTLDHLQKIVINETQELTIKPTALDPDGDIVKFFFSEPVTRRGGTWKTNYENEGTYTVQVTASDGKLEHTRPINITVIKSNRQPSIKIEKDKLVVNEGKEFTLVVDAEDPDNDNLTIKLENLPEGASFNDGILKWSPLFNTVQKL